MTEGTRRERLRGDMDREIREQTRRLLVEHGTEAVTLRAIGRRLGITAPALYRYYASREDLLRRVCDDICADLGTELTNDFRAVSEDNPLGGVFAVCRGFRRWALAHPREFALVFASPDKEESANDQFGQIFLTVAGRVLANHRLPAPVETGVPDELHDDLMAFRATLVDILTQQGIDLPEHALSLATVYFMLQFWVRLYGQVALEVFGRFPFTMSSAEPLFESMLTELASDINQLGTG